VGTVCFSFVFGKKIISETRRFRGNRTAVRRQSVVHALKGLVALLPRG
jgi:nicotinamide mononucleotide (NMN) deamidase PncC